MKTNEHTWDKTNASGMPSTRLGPALKIEICHNQTGF
jgi:hypothetical protein